VNVVCNTPQSDFTANDTFIRAVRGNGEVVRAALAESQRLRYEASLEQVAAMRERGKVVSKALSLSLFVSFSTTNLPYLCCSRPPAFMYA
jgi:hypothetical protein